MTRIARDLVEQALSDFKYARLEGRREEITKYIDFYTGTSIDQYIKPWFNQRVFGEVPVYQLNITKKFINKLSRIYTLGTERKSTKQYLKWTKNKDAMFKHIEKMTKLLGTIATRIEFDPVIGYSYKPLYFFSPFFDDNDPFNPIAIAYPLLPPTDDVSFKGDEKFAYWDDEWYMEFNNDGEMLVEHYHGMGDIPFVFTHRENQIDSCFVEGASDIVAANEQVNIALTELQLGMRFQMFGQPWASGVYEEGETARLGTDEIVQVPEGGAFGIASPGGDIAGAIAAIKFQIELVAQANHLWVHWAEQGGEMPSGISLIIKDFERIEDYKDDIDLWRGYEHQFYVKEQMVAALHGKTLPDKFSVNFIEPEYPKNVQDQIAKDSFDLKHGLITLPQLMMRDNKDLTIEEAKKLVDENQEENKNVMKNVEKGDSDGTEKSDKSIRESAGLLQETD